MTSLASGGDAPVNPNNWNARDPHRGRAITSIRQTEGEAAEGESEAGNRRPSGVSTMRRRLTVRVRVLSRSSRCGRSLNRVHRATDAVGNLTELRGIRNILKLSYQLFENLFVDVEMELDRLVDVFSVSGN